MRKLCILYDYTSYSFRTLKIIVEISYSQLFQSKYSGTKTYHFNPASKSIKRVPDLIRKLQAALSRAVFYYRNNSVIILYLTFDIIVWVVAQCTYFPFSNCRLNFPVRAVFRTVKFIVNVSLLSQHAAGWIYSHLKKTIHRFKTYDL